MKKLYCEKNGFKCYRNGDELSYIVTYKDKDIYKAYFDTEIKIEMDPNIIIELGFSLEETSNFLSMTHFAKDNLEIDLELIKRRENKS